MDFSLEEFRNNFGIYQIPDALEALFVFDAPPREWYSGRFELAAISKENLLDHVKEDHLSQFFGFGHDGNYSLYALWRYKEVPLDDAPVVYLNSEGEGSTILANNILEFFTLLARDESPIFGKYSEKDDRAIKHTVRNQEFREWLEQRYHLRPAENPNDVIRQASRQHPSLPLVY